MDSGLTTCHYKCTCVIREEINKAWSLLGSLIPTPSREVCVGSGFHIKKGWKLVISDMCKVAISAT